jgi:hypothetical protein
MNKRIEHCLYLAGLTAQGCWDQLGTYEQEAIEKFAELIIKDVILEIGSAKIQHCALTTHDLGIVNCVDAKITNHLLSTFGIKQQFGVFNANNS